MKKGIKDVIPPSVVKFGITGALGTVTNLIVFYILADLLGLPSMVASACAFCLAVSQNFLLNSRWTFSDSGRTHEAPIAAMKLYCKFFLSSLSGLAVNLGVLALLLRFFDFPIKTIPQAIGIFCGMAVNYLFSRYLVFIKTKGTDDDGQK